MHFYSKEMAQAIAVEVYLGSHLSSKVPCYQGPQVWVINFVHLIPSFQEVVQQLMSLAFITWVATGRPNASASLIIGPQAVQLLKLPRESRP